MADKVTIAELLKAQDPMRIYDFLREVPKDAQKKITGGRLNGFTDINPMWRIQRLTEAFGPCGLGWYTEVADRWTEEANGEVSAHVRIKLYYRVGDKKDDWSAPIEGVGGSKLLTKESNGFYHSDEAFKMAYTDAISVACKALGMAADIYFAKGVTMKDNRTKYDQASEAPADEPERPTNIDPDTYWKVVAAYAAGRVAKSGEDYRTRFVALYKPSAAQLRRFDADVENYKVSHQ